MKLKYLVIIGLLISLTNCKKRPDCAPGILYPCKEKIMGSTEDYDICECVCSKDGTGGVYKSSIDDNAICWKELSYWSSTDYEKYAFDHHHVRSDGFVERVIGIVSISYDSEELVDKDIYPYQGQVFFELHYPQPLTINSCREPNGFEELQPFYMKENNRDTLFMDKLVGFYFANTHVICGDFYFTKSYMVRSEEGIDWYCNLYGVPEGANEVDIRFAAHNDEIEPDTTFFIHMPRLFKKG